MTPVIAKNDLGPCAGCGAHVEKGEWVVHRNEGVTHAGCYPRQTGRVAQSQPQDCPLLFDDAPRSVIEEAKEVLGASAIRFAGSSYIPKYDQVRLTKKLLMVFDLMRDQKYRTINEIYDELDHQVAHTTISANLRHLKKEEFGSHTMNKRRRGDDRSGVYEYQIIENRQATKAA